MAKQQARNAYKTAMVGAIASAILILPEFITGLLVGAASVPGWVHIAGVVLCTLGFATSLLTLWGYWQIAKQQRSRGLNALIRLAVVLSVLSLPLNWYIFLSASKPAEWLAIGFCVLAGIVYMAFGIALAKLKRNVQNLTKPLGILYIVDGAMTITIVLLLLNPIVEIGICIMEAVLFYRLAHARKN